MCTYITEKMETFENLSSRGYTSDRTHFFVVSGPLQSELTVKSHHHVDRACAFCGVDEARVPLICGEHHVAHTSLPATHIATNTATHTRINCTAHPATHPATHTAAPCDTLCNTSLKNRMLCVRKGAYWGEGGGDVVEVYAKQEVESPSQTHSCI